MSGIAGAAHTLILDPGTALLKAGTSQQSLPSLVVGSLVGRPVKKKGLLSKKVAAAPEEELPEHIFGQDALTTPRVTLTQPLERGVVTRWDDMEQLINHCFTDLAIEPESSGACVALPLFSPHDYSERFAQTMFESFEVKHFSIVSQGLCALYASGRTTGVVLESGEGVTLVTPVYDSYVVTSAANRIGFGGADVTTHLKRLMYERGYNFSSLADTMNISAIKEKAAYVAQGYFDEMRQPEEITAHELPDGQEIKMGKEKFRCAEILFDPAIVQSEMPAMGLFVAQAIKNCAIDTRRDLSSNIILSGGNTLLAGFGGRLRMDVCAQFPGLFGSVSVVDAPDRLMNVWSGASVLSNLSTFADHVISRDAYDEVGPAIVHQQLGRSKADQDDAPPDA